MAADLWLHTSVENVEQTADGYRVKLLREGKAQTVTCRNLVLATGGKSIPKMGATGLAYDLARQFGLEITDTRPALVPFTFPDGRFKPLVSVSCPRACRTSARPSTRRCCSPTAASQDLRCCSSPPTGAKARRSPRT